MEEPFNPYREQYANMTPVEFEEHCISLLNSLSDFSSIHEVVIEHNRICASDDGEYQIDGYIEYIAFGVKHKVIVECKRHKAPIKRDIVAVLHAKLNSLGAQKGILMSTSGFQQGAITYAKEHGIALLQVLDGSIFRILMSATPPTPEFIQYCLSIPRLITGLYDLNLSLPIYRLPSDNDEFERFLCSKS